MVVDEDKEVGGQPTQDVGRRPGIPVSSETIWADSLTSAVSLDKQLLGLSTFGIGLHIALLSSLGAGGRVTMWLLVFSLGTFTMTLLLALCGLRAHSETLHYRLGVDENQRWLSKHILGLDKVMIGMFLVAVGLSVAVGVSFAMSSAELEAEQEVIHVEADMPVQVEVVTVDGSVVGGEEGEKGSIEGRREGGQEEE